MQTADGDGAGVALVATAVAGAYMVTPGGSPPGMRGHARLADGQVRPQTAVQFLAAIAGELESRGLMVRPSHRRGMVTEIAASSPVHPEQGAVRIGYDGFLIWERWAPAADSDRAAEIVRLIAWVLYGGAPAADGDAR